MKINEYRAKKKNSKNFGNCVTFWHLKDNWKWCDYSELKAWAVCSSNSLRRFRTLLSSWTVLSLNLVINGLRKKNIWRIVILLCQFSSEIFDCFFKTWTITYEIWEFEHIIFKHSSANVQRLGTTDLVPHRIDTQGCVIRKQETHNLRSNNKLNCHCLYLQT